MSQKRIIGRREIVSILDLELFDLDVKIDTCFMRERDIIIKDPSNQSYFMIGLHYCPVKVDK